MSAHNHLYVILTGPNGLQRPDDLGVQPEPFAVVRNVSGLQAAFQRALRRHDGDCLACYVVCFTEGSCRALQISGARGWTLADSLANKGPHGDWPEVAIAAACRFAPARWVEEAALQAGPLSPFAAKG